MNIIRKENKNHLFDEISIGGIFECGDTIFMKFREIVSNGHVYNAIGLEDGEITCFMSDEEIQPVNADLVIH